MIKESIIKAYALKNALSHKGKVLESAVINALFNEGLKKEDIKGILPRVKKIVEEVNSMSIQEQEREFELLKELVKERPKREGLPELEDVGEEGIITRFSPSPSGPLHVGHALTASLSFLYVIKYGGKLYVRIEDTNPKNIYLPAYEMIEEDVNWLFKGKAEIVIQSNRMELYYNYIERLIERGYAYVCRCENESFKQLVKKGEACQCRLNSPKENLHLWEKMKLTDEFREGEAVVRFKSGLKLRNPAMREFPLARIIEEPHPLTGKKYRVWPLMNLAVAVDDIEMRITHIIRAKDHRDNAIKQKMIFDALEKEFPRTYFLGRIHFLDLELSSSEMRKQIDEGIYRGWDDPRLPTLISLRKRGYKPEAFWKFAEQIGLNETDKKMDQKEFFLLLDNFNRKHELIL